MPMIPPTSTWLRMAVTPLPSSSRAARVARSTTSRRETDGQCASHAAMAPARSPGGLRALDPVSALSRWACGSAGAASSRYPARSILLSPAAGRTLPAAATAAILPRSTRTSTVSPLATVTPASTSPAGAVPPPEFGNSSEDAMLISITFQMSKIMNIRAGCI
jgi:hypothetical protein